MIRDKIIFIGKIYGHTLVELLVALAIFSILAALFSPNLRNLTVNNKVTTEINTLSADLMFACSEVIRRDLPVMVSAISNSNNWNSGWRIRFDTSGDRNQ